MRGTTRNGRARRRSRVGRRAWISRLLLTLFLTGASVAAPGIASAEPLTLTGSVDCVIPGSGGAFTAILGYQNTLGHSVWLPDGWLNLLTPFNYSGRQPTTFDPGVHHGVFSVRITDGAATWWLVGTPVAITETSAPHCPPPTQMPGDGNGSGVAIGLVIAGVLGVLIVRRLQRRLVADGAAACSPSSPRYNGLEADHA